MKRNLYLCVDLAATLQDDPILQPGKLYVGTLRLDAPSENNHFRDDLLSFNEIAPLVKACHRNPCHYQGQLISGTIQSDGKPRLNFKQLKLGPDFDKFRYASEVMNEIIQALDLAGL